MGRENSGEIGKDISIGEYFSLRRIVFPNSFDTSYVCGFNGLVGRTLMVEGLKPNLFVNESICYPFPINPVCEKGVILKTSDYGGIGIRKAKGLIKINKIILFDLSNIVRRKKVSYLNH